MAKYRPSNGTKYLAASWMLSIPECLLRTPVRCLTVLRLRQRPPLFGTRRPIAPKRIYKPTSGSIVPFAAQWLRNLIAAGHIAPGEVDERSILDVRPDDLAGYTQCHFFAGIGGWSYALRMAAWGDDQPVWTGSCPCQPFSLAGKQKGFDDDRHLWPIWRELIRECRPARV